MLKSALAHDLEMKRMLNFIVMMPQNAHEQPNEVILSISFFCLQIE